jgi:hypothetical protein
MSTAVQSSPAARELAGRPRRIGAQVQQAQTWPEVEVVDEKSRNPQRCTDVGEVTGLPEVAG